MTGDVLAPRRLTAMLRDPETGVMLSAIANQFLVSGGTFLIGIAAARWLGLEQFGRFTLVLTVAVLFQGLQNSFLLMPMMTLAGRRSGRSRYYYRGLMATNIWASAITGLIVAVSLAIGFGWRDGSIPWGLIVSAGAYAASQNFLYTMRRVMFARRETWGALVLDVGRYLVLAAIILLLWSRFGTVNLEGLLAALAGSAVLAAAPFAVRVGVRGAGSRLLGAIWRRHWPSARWLLPMTIVTFAQEQAITLSLGFLLSDEAVGGLRAGQYLLGVTHFVMMAQENFVPNGAARALSTGGRPELRRFLLNKMIVFGIPTGALILLIACNAEASLRLAFGAGYERFAPLLYVFALSYVCIFIRDMVANYFRAIERTDVIFRAFLAGCVISALLVIPALRSLGEMGAALLILSTNLSSMLYVLWVGWRDWD